MKLPALLAVALIVAMQQLSAGVTAEELADARQWFNSLSWPDVRGKAYVEIGRGPADDPEKYFPSQIRGFLLEETDSTLTLLSDGTRTHLQGRSGVDWPLIPTSFAKADYTVRRRESLDEAAERVLGAQARREAEKESIGFNSFYEKLSDRTALFVFARFCQRQDRADLAAKVDAVVMTMEAPWQRGGRQRPGTFREAIEQEIGTTFMWKAVKGFGHPKLGRAELLRQFERIVRDFPQSGHGERAEQFAEQLRAMVAEDAAHQPQPLENLPAAEQARELVFQLRDQTGVQMTQPGWCDIFTDWERKEETPAHRLVKLGLGAVPALMEALEDSRPTRAVGQHRDFYFSHYVLTIGECAQRVLERIAGRSFHSDHNRVRKDAPTTRQLVDAWWSEVREKGEATVLAEGVRAGTRESAAQATQLAALDPALALPAIEAGIAGTKSAQAQRELMRCSRVFRPRNRRLLCKRSSAPRQHCRGASLPLPRWRGAARPTRLRRCWTSGKR